MDYKRIWSYYLNSVGKSLVVLHSVLLFKIKSSGWKYIALLVGCEDIN